MKINYLKYWVLFIFVILKTAVLPFFLPSGGITSDSVDYFRITVGFPKIVTDLFPLGYPFLVKIFYYIIPDYFYSTKIINVLGICFIGLFSYYKKFFFKETIILLTFKIFSLFLFSYSEPPFLVLEYLLVYYFHQYFSGELKGIRFVFPASVIMVCMFLVRYSGIYIYLAIGLYFLYYTIKNKLFKTFYYKSYFYFLIFSAIGILGYVGFNYTHFNDFIGESSRGLPNYNNIYTFSHENFLGVINVLNPILSVKVTEYSSSIMLLIGIVLILIDISLLFMFFIGYKKLFKKEVNYFHQLLLTIGIVYLGCMIFSEYTQRIEIISTRMICESSFVLFFSFLILYYKCFPAKTKWLFILGVISLLYSIIAIIKTPSNYLKNREKVEYALKKRKEVKYFYRDSNGGDGKMTIKIPFIDKKIDYTNVNIISGNYNLYIVTGLVPSIKLISNDKDIKDKNQILYNSQIK